MRDHLGHDLQDQKVPINSEDKWCVNIRFSLFLFHVFIMFRYIVSVMSVVFVVSEVSSPQ